MKDSPKSSFRLDYDIPLSKHTTIGLGGNAALFAVCNSLDELRQHLSYANEREFPVQIIGSGSNIIFPDTGFPGLVIKVGLRGVEFLDDGDATLVVAAAGEEWDGLVASCINRGLGGIECLSGIPGLVGATPIQNVGAYGQEVRDTIVSLNALDQTTNEVVSFSSRECGFAYRQSRFKSRDADKYIITQVTFRLRNEANPDIRYPELRTYLESTVHLETLSGGRPSLLAVREAVLALRRRKSMVIDPTDPHTRSVGSFFVNPVLTQQDFRHLEERWKSAGHSELIPTFPAGEKVKVPAAWLVEHSGFHKGYRMGGVGISVHHALALVNYGGTTRELLDLARKMQEKVHERFGIHLEREPVIVES